jgi:hypothetical protein
VSDQSDHDDGETVEEEQTPLKRVLDLLVFAPVGVALTVAEDLPGLIGKGRQRFETDVQNARVIGQFIVTHGQREVVERVGKLLHRPSSDPAASPDDGTTGAPAPPVTGAASAASVWATPASPASPTPTPKPDADPADGVIVEGALAGYDTLSASQVVRRLESLGPEELRAIHRHEASHRNRRTILNRAHQILEAKGAAGAATPPAAAAPPTAATPPAAAAPPTAATPPMAEAPESDRPSA